MQLIQIEIYNFVSIVYAVMPFTPGLHYVAGKNWDMGADEDETNGAGKSSLFEAIQWCLFGTLPRGRPEKADDVVNNVVGKNCRVILTYTHEGKTFIVMRTRKDEEYGTGLRYWIDNVEQTQHRNKDTDAELLSDLPISEETFRHAVMVGQGMPDRFLALSEPAKHDLICQIANVTVFDLALARAKDEHKRTEVEAKVLLGAAQSLNEQRSAVVADLEVQQNFLQQEEQAPDVNLDEVRRVEEHLKEQIAKLDQEISTLNEEISAKNLERTEATEKSYSLREAWQNADTEVAARGGDVSHRYNDLLALKTQIDRIDGDIQDARENPEKCVLCKKIPEYNAGTDCENLREYIKELSAERDRVIALYDERTKEYTPLQEAYAQWRAYSDAQREASTQQDKIIEALMSHISGLQAAAEGKRAQQQQFRTDCEELTSRRQAKEQKLDVIRAKIEQLQGTVTRLAEQIEQKITALHEKEKAARHWKYWVVSIPNLRAAAIAKLLAFVNQRIDHYMQTLSAGAMGMELYQKAHGKGSKIQVDLRTPGGNYVMSSGGQRRRIDLAVFLALFDLLQMSSGIHFNVIVCDEIMDGLSPPGVRKLAGIFRQLADSGKSVYVISHNPAVQQMCQFDSVSTVELRGGKATLKTTQELSSV